MSPPLAFWFCREFYCWEHPPKEESPVLSGASLSPQAVATRSPPLIHNSPSSPPPPPPFIPFPLFHERTLQAPPPPPIAKQRPSLTSSIIVLSSARMSALERKHPAVGRLRAPPRTNLRLQGPLPHVPPIRVISQVVLPLQRPFLPTH